MKSPANTSTTKNITSLNQTFLEIEHSKPAVVKRRAQPDHITANFKRRSTYKWVDFNLLRTDHIYQRNLRRSKAILLAHRWNPDKAGTLVVNKRANGLYYIIDGQHRFEALNLISNHPPKIYCEVYNALTLEEEARLFHDLDNERDNLTRGASFKALLAAKDESALAISRAAEKAGMTVDYDRGPVVGNVRAFKTLQDIYRRAGADTLERILRVCNQSWPTSNHAAPEGILRALEILFGAYGKGINDHRLIEVLSKSTPDQVTAMGRQINGTLSSAVYPSIAIVIRNLYNKRMSESRRLDTSISLGF